MKNRSKVPLVRLFGIIALVAVIGFSMTACGGDDDGGGGGGGGGGSGGKFTLTGIPSEYNGKYALYRGYIELADSTSVPHFGCEDPNVGVWGSKMSRISNGSVSMPMWVLDVSKFEWRRYSGNDTINGPYSEVWICDSQTLSYDSTLTVLDFDSVTFSKGSATKSWSQGEVKE
ncbi:MAG: hypothetical protein LBB89_10290 [Treponema sp.]|jgi:hypothetical protein|nr:hypothetical protein [Treponema sp.]